jgi:hypothetical protein
MPPRGGGVAWSIMRTHLPGVWLLASAAAAFGQPPLHGVRANGDFLYIERATGHGWPIASTGLTLTGAAGYATSYGRFGTRDYMLAVGLDAQGQSVLVGLEQYGGWLHFQQLIPCPTGTRVRGIADAGPTTVTVLLETAAGENAVASFDRIGGLLSTPVALGVGGLTGFASDATETLYALGPASGGTLYRLSPHAVPVWVGGLQNCRSILVDTSGRIVAAGSELRVLDLSAGTNTLVGTTGLTDVLGLQSDFCYPNCSDGAPPMLSVLDLNCFVQHFAAGSDYANCDGSTTSPVLNVLDFNCFLNLWSLGCQCCP